MNLFLETIVVNAQDMEKMKNFWTTALGFEIDFANEGFALLKNPRSESNTKFGLQLTDKPKTNLNRLHIDLITSDGKTEVKRLEDLGAKVIPWTYGDPNPSYVVMADPEGNEFCVSTVSTDNVEKFKEIYKPS